MRKSRSGSVTFATWPHRTTHIPLCTVFIVVFSTTLPDEALQHQHKTQRESERERQRKGGGMGEGREKEVSLPLSSKPIRIFCLSQRVLAALKYLPDEWKIAIVYPARTHCLSRLRLLVSFWTTSIFLFRFLLFFLQSHQFSIMQTLPGCRFLSFLSGFCKLQQLAK